MSLKGAKRGATDATLELAAELSVPPAGWTPPTGRRPDPSRGPAPNGWRFWSEEPSSWGASTPKAMTGAKPVAWWQSNGSVVIALVLFFPLGLALIEAAV